MHKKALELAEWVIEKACDHGYDNLTSQDWDDFKDCMEVAEKAAKTEYYYKIIEAMENADEEVESRRGYEEPPYYHVMPEMYREYDRGMNRYYTHDGSESEYERNKRMYTESKMVHKANTPTDKEARMKDLENYLHSLVNDVSGLITDATAEEKMQIKAKIQAIAQKIV